MAFFNSSSQFILFLSMTTFLLLSFAPNAASFYQSKKSNPIISTPTQAYIIRTDNLTRPPHFPTQTHWYSSIVKSAIITADTSSHVADHHRRIFYTYDNVMHGFAATLTPQEAKRVSETPGVVGVFNDSIIQLHTTRSPDFLGLGLGSIIWPESNFGEDAIIGLVDTGIWPESAAFDDIGLPPVPSQWRGECESGDRFNVSLCNKKLIGARFFDSGRKARGEGFDNGTLFMSPRDADGHGTHTASIAAGSAVANASLFGFARGTARGMATRARVAMYKACWGGVCHSSDIMAGMDMAIKDGVHILSLSLGGGPSELDTDIVAIGAFAAVRNGIFVVCSAGNNGWEESTVENAAPWIATVGAASIDREFSARVTLGNGEVYIGESLYAGRLNNTGTAPLVYLPDCSEVDTMTKPITGKILVCGSDYSDQVSAGMQVAAAGGVGLIGLNGATSGEGILVEAFTLPALTLGYSEAKKLAAYMNSTSNPKASLEFSYQTVIGERRAPTVAFFSSRGPSKFLPEILKPDILAPGMNIIASWPTETPVSDTSSDQRRAGFNIMSGTSMSCPHVAGIAALLRAAYPQWSPAMIRSAMMTTASALDNSYRPIILDENLKPATLQAIGAGHVQPLRALDPGLVYDAGIQDYIDLLCTMNYTLQQLRTFVPGPVSCSKFVEGTAGLNYPSFVVLFDNKTDVRTLTRTLTKVSELPETYEARVVNPRPDKLEVTVEPKKLEFGCMGERLTYKVHFRSNMTFDWSFAKEDVMEYGYIIWENSEHQVKSPVVFMWRGPSGL